MPGRFRWRRRLRVEIVESDATELLLLGIEISNWRNSGRPFRLETAAPSGNRGEQRRRATTYGYQNLQLEKLWRAALVGDDGPEWKSVENAAGLPLVAIEISNWRSCDGPLALEAAAPIENRGERHHRATTFGYRNLQLEKLWPAVSVGDGGSEWKSWRTAPPATTYGYRNLQLEKLWPAASVGDGGSQWKSVENSDAELLLLAIGISNWRSCDGRPRLGQVEENQVAKNLRVVTKPAEYGRPELQQVEVR